MALARMVEVGGQPILSLNLHGVGPVGDTVKAPPRSAMALTRMVGGGCQPFSHLISTGLDPWVTLSKPRCAMALARMVEVVVPSPASSLVLLATSYAQQHGSTSCRSPFIYIVLLDRTASLYLV